MTQGENYNELLASGQVKIAGKPLNMIFRTGGYGISLSKAISKVGNTCDCEQGHKEVATSPQRRRFEKRSAATCGIPDMSVSIGNGLSGSGPVCALAAKEDSLLPGGYDGVFALPSPFIKDHPFKEMFSSIPGGIIGMYWDTRLSVADSHGELHFGAIPKNKVSDAKWAPLDEDEVYWRIKASSVTYEEETVNPTLKTVIDTSVHYGGFEKSIFDLIVKTLGAKLDSATNRYIVPSYDEIPDGKFSLKISRTTIQFNAYDLVEYDFDSAKVFLGCKLTTRYNVIGTAILSNYDVLLDYNLKQIGFTAPSLKNLKRPFDATSDFMSGAYSQGTSSPYFSSSESDTDSPARKTRKTY